MDERLTFHEVNEAIHEMSLWLPLEKQKYLVTVLAFIAQETLDQLNLTEYAQQLEFELFGDEYCEGCVLS